MSGYNIDIAHCQQIAFNSSGSTASTNGVSSQKLVVYATKDCFINEGASPTAAASGAASVFVPAQTFFELNVQASTYKLAARGASESGTLYINPLL